MQEKGFWKRIIKPNIFAMAVVVGAFAFLAWLFPWDGDTPTKPVISCSLQWSLPLDWHQAGVIDLGSDGKMSFLTGDLDVTTATVASRSHELSFRVQKVKNQTGVTLRNIAPNQRAGITFHNEKAEVCWSELAPEQVVSTGGHISKTTVLAFYLVDSDS